MVFKKHNQTNKFKELTYVITREKGLTMEIQRLLNQMVVKFYAGKQLKYVLDFDNSSIIEYRILEPGTEFELAKLIADRKGTQKRVEQDYLKYGIEYKYTENDHRVVITENKLTEVYNDGTVYVIQYVKEGTYEL